MNAGTLVQDINGTLSFIDRLPAGSLNTDAIQRAKKTLELYRGKAWDTLDENDQMMVISATSDILNFTKNL